MEKGGLVENEKEIWITRRCTKMHEDARIEKLKKIEIPLVGEESLIINF